MSKIIIGCDPDSKASGIAVYIDGVLKELECLPLIDIFTYFQITCEKTDDIELHLENVKGKKAVWHAGKESKAAYGMTCQRVGQCKQVQTEIERVAEHFGIEVVLHPVSSAWKKGASKSQFKLITKWPKSGNKDSRSAAYFGWLGTRV